MSTKSNDAESEGAKARDHAHSRHHFWKHAHRDWRVWVAVSDSKTGEAFSVPVGDDERALDVFHHPYAYAAARGVPMVADSRLVNSGTSLAA